MKRSVLLLLFSLFIFVNGTFSQARVILNGAYINITNAAFVVVDNSASNAITRNSGHIISEGENNRVKWNIGNVVGTFTVPWGYSNTNYIPLSFTKTAGVAVGNFIFSTYRTGTWQNSLFLPTGVLHVNNILTGLDNSAFVIDRFWQIFVSRYATKPDLSNLVFSYVDVEHSVPLNTIVEGNLQAMRWNSTIPKWGDWGPFGIDDAILNTVTVSLVKDTDLFRWWTLVDKSQPLPIELTLFDAKCDDGKVKLQWTTESETNNNFFTVEKSNDGTHWTSVTEINGAGNSTQPIHYSYSDGSPTAGINYYRLKQTDYDGHYSYSSIVPVVSCDYKLIALIFPNPADENLAIWFSSDEANVVLQIHNDIGQLVYSENLSVEKGQLHPIKTSAFANGIYTLSVESEAERFFTKMVIHH